MIRRELGMPTPLIKYLLLGLVISIITPKANAAEDSYAKYIEQSRKITQEFTQQLGSTLKQQLETAGAESAIHVCKEIAPALARQHSTDDILVKRVSLKPRNPT